MFFFIMPRPDLTIFHLAIGARDLNHAFEQFQRDWFRPEEHTRAIGVWMNAALIARVLPITDIQTDKLTCFLQEIAR